MLDFEETRSLLDKLAEELPPGIFEGLNGGVILLPDHMPDPNNPGLLIMGQYRCEPFGLGRSVVIYHGSFAEACRHDTRRRIEEKLREVLHHELTHHLESLAGDRSLELEDERYIERYRRSRRGRRDNDGQT